MPWLIVIPIVIVYFLSGIRIVRPTERGLVERLGKYRKFASPGFNWIIPVIDRMIVVNITETMVDAEPQEIITNDNLNAKVDAQVYFKVKADEGKRQEFAVQCEQLQMADRKSCTNDAAKHHRHTDIKIGKQ